LHFLKELVELGVLVEQAVGKEKLFIHPKLMKILTRDENGFDRYITRGDELLG
jgi:hypothetical protein